MFSKPSKRCDRWRTTYNLPQGGEGLREPLAEIHPASSTGASFPTGPAAFGSGRVGLVILILILGVGAFLRFHNLGEKSLRTDELFTLVGSRGDFQDVLDFSRLDTHPPLHWVIAWLIRPFGETEFLLRLPSAVAGLFTILGLYLAGWWLFDDRLVGIVAAFWLAVSPAHVWHSREAWMYAYEATLSLGSFVALWGILSGPKSRRPIWGSVWALATTFALYNSCLAVTFWLLRRWCGPCGRYWSGRGLAKAMPGPWIVFFRFRFSPLLCSMPPGLRRSGIL